MAKLEVETPSRNDFDLISVSLKKIKFKLNGNTITITDFISFRPLFKAIMEGLRWW